jgi:hypothetical protein
MLDEKAVAWLREKVEARLGAARSMLSEHWGDMPWAVEECSECGCPCIVYQGEHKPLGEPQVPPVRYIADAETPAFAQWITANDPRQVIADCEADLELLATHRIVNRNDPDYSVDPGATGCASCHYWAQMHVRGRGMCRTVRLLARRYRHWPGYDKHWGTADPIFTQ